MVNLRKKRPRSDAIIGQAQTHVDEYIAEPPPQQYSQYPEEAAAAFAQAQAQHLAVQQAAAAAQMDSQVCRALSATIISKGAAHSQHSTCGY